MAWNVFVLYFFALHVKNLVINQVSHHWDEIDGLEFLATLGAGIIALRVSPLLNTTLAKDSVVTKLAHFRLVVQLETNDARKIIWDLPILVFGLIQVLSNC